MTLEQIPVGCELIGYIVATWNPWKPHGSSQNQLKLM